MGKDCEKEKVDRFKILKQGKSKGNKRKNLKCIINT